MPKRTDLQKILVLGSGPIVIGQACEFDYSGTQACKALREEGMDVILINSNPATIMTDPETAHRVYIEPLARDYVEKIIELERPDALIPTLGGQTALNVAMDLDAAGILKKYNVELLGASVEAIKKAEDREAFKKIMGEIGAEVARSFTVRSVKEGLNAAEALGFPIVLRPSFTLGGSGGGIAESMGQFEEMLKFGLRESPTSEVLVEESILGWKEFELEVMRDHKGTFVVICTIENLDPMGVHTGDSITVAPALTLTDRDYQAMRDEACKVINKIGVATGGANIQFAVEPKTGRRIVIEMNPRVSRSSALASKATGFPIAKIAAKLAIGYQLEELLNDITKSTPSCFEPSIDYVVTKIPKFNFEKFPGTEDALSTQMKSVGEVMAMGRTFQESFQKALASLEVGTEGFDEVEFSPEKLIKPSSQRIYYVGQAFRQGWTVDEVFEATKITRWFLEKIKDIIEAEKSISLSDLKNREKLLQLKQKGFSDKRLAHLLKVDSASVTADRKKLGVIPGYWNVDTCAGEFESKTPYFYSSYHTSPRAPLDLEDAVVVIGSGPNRIGQGIEFDYGCVQGIRAAKELGHTTVMINCNPETVSTDYDTSDYLFFEPLTVEHVGNVLDFVKPMGVVVQLGGQTPINMAGSIRGMGYRILGTSVEGVETSEDRKKFGIVCKKLGLMVPGNRIATTASDALNLAEQVGYPVICRPSFVLGGRRMEVIRNKSEMENYLIRAKDVMSERSPLLIDEFLEDCLEVDVDVVSDGNSVLIGGIVEHIEGAGVHSGDSMGVLPPQRIHHELLTDIESLSRKLALELKIIGHLNLQLAIKEDRIYVLEANPRSSRSVPFVSKATQIPLVRLALESMLGRNLMVTNYWRDSGTISVKGVVYPFKKFPGTDIILGPEMKSTGESMGRSCQPQAQYSEALEKAFVSAGVHIPYEGKVFFTIRDSDKKSSESLARSILDCGFQIVATGGTAEYLKAKNIAVEITNKVRQGSPHCVDLISNGDIKLVINTASGSQSIAESLSIRRSCVERNIPCLTEISTAKAFVQVLESRKNKKRPIRVHPLTSAQK